MRDVPCLVYVLRTSSQRESGFGCIVPSQGVIEVRYLRSAVNCCYAAFALSPLSIICVWRWEQVIGRQSLVIESMLFGLVSHSPTGRVRASQCSRPLSTVASSLILRAYNIALSPALRHALKSSLRHAAAGRGLLRVKSAETFAYCCCCIFKNDSDLRCCWLDDAGRAGNAFVSDEDVRR